LTKAIRHHSGVPEPITIDDSATNEAAITRDNQAHGTAITIRQITYLHHIVEQDHRAAQGTCAGIELMHRLRTGHLEGARTA
jgi:transposase-like protein